MGWQCTEAKLLSLYTSQPLRQRCSRLECDVQGAMVTRDYANRPWNNAHLDLVFDVWTLGSIADLEAGVTTFYNSV